MSDSVRPTGLRSIARAWFWFILAGTLIGALVAFALAAAAAPSYTSRVTLLVTPAPKAAGITNSDLQVAQALTPTFAELATTGPVLDRVIQTTKIDTDTESLIQSVTTHVPVDTSLLSINVSNRDAIGAAALANAIASELRAYAPPGGSDATAGLQVVLTVVDPAIPPTVRDGPGLLTRVGLGAAIALFLTISIAFLGENISSQNLALVRRSTHAIATSATRSQPSLPDEMAKGRAQSDQTGRSSSTIGIDPLAKGSASKARMASRGVINDLEVERLRRGE